ncbi:MAG: GTPase Era [Hyphomicrobiales bacterium]|jgi:GTPase|nr:GTPase Era [Hyphomicrobiales bacterium]
MSQVIENKFKCGHVAIVGSPNVGKSTLLNAIIRKKISIVSHKVQTTRTRIQAILSKDSSQIIFIDTPGIFKPKKLRERPLVREAWKSLDQANVIIFVLDATKEISDVSLALLDEVSNSNIELIVVLNKIDLVDKEELLSLIDKIKVNNAVHNIFLISALKYDGVLKLLDDVIKKIPYGEWIYPKEMSTNISDMAIAEEFTREKIYQYVHKEIPYSIIIDTENWIEKSKNVIQVHQNIYVTNNNHKKIILGKDGEKIKQISIESRLDIEQYLNKKVHLYLYIKLRKNNYISNIS